MWIKPRVVLIEETGFWRDDLAMHAGKIYGVYLYDENRVVHCCELQGSYELNALEVATLNNETCPETVRDEIDAEWHSSTERISYFHTHTVDEWEKFPLSTQRCRAEDYDEVWEELMQCCRENSPYYRLPDYQLAAAPV